MAFPVDALFPVADLVVAVIVAVAVVAAAVATVLVLVGTNGRPLHRCISPQSNNLQAPWLQLIPIEDRNPMK